MSEFQLIHEACLRKEAEESATKAGGFFDFEDLPEGCGGLQSDQGNSHKEVFSRPHRAPEKEEAPRVPPPRLAAAAAISRGGIDVEGLQEQLAKFQLKSSDLDDQSYRPQALAVALSTQNLEEKEALALLKKRADLSCCTGDLQRTALHLAAEKCHVNLIEELLKCRADPNRADRAGESPLFVLAHSISWSSAPSKQRKACVQRLVEGEADINFANPRAKTPLHVAVSCNDGAVVCGLLDEMADVNARDLGGFTALMWAAGRGGVEQVQQLLKAKAQSEVMANRGQTAMLFAVTNHCHEVATILEAQAKAEPEQQPEEQRNSAEMNLPYMGKAAKLQTKPYHLA